MILVLQIMYALSLVLLAGSKLWLRFGLPKEFREELAFINQHISEIIPNYKRNIWIGRAYAVACFMLFCT